MNTQQPVQEHVISTTTPELQPVVKEHRSIFPKKIYRAVAQPNSLRLIVKGDYSLTTKSVKTDEKTEPSEATINNPALDGFGAFPVVVYEDCRRGDSKNYSIYPALIDGEERQVLLDTGSPRNLINISMSGFLDIDETNKPMIQGIGENRIQSYGCMVMTVDLKLGPMNRIKNLDFVVVPGELDNPVIGLEGLENFEIRSEHRAGRSSFEFIKQDDRTLDVFDVVNAMENIKRGPWRPQMFDALRELEAKRKLN